MYNETLLVGFIAAALVVLLIPGPGVVYVIARSASQGVRAGLASALGLSVGALVHVAAAAAGLSVILLTSATVFSIVKLLGAGYLIYLGLTALFAPRPAAEMDPPSPNPVLRLFMDGVVVSIFNPKIAVFFLAFLPQFVDQESGPVSAQILSLGLIYAGLAFFTDGAYALLAGALRHLAQGRFMQGPWPRYIIGSLYIGLGMKAAFSEQK